MNPKKQIYLNIAVTSVHVAEERYQFTVNPILAKLDVRTCAKLILQDGSKEEKRKLLEQLKSRIILKDDRLIIEKLRKK